jgi:cell division protein FtsB
MSDTAASAPSNTNRSLEEQEVRNNLESLQAAHNALLERIRKDGEHGEGGAEELNRLRERIKELESELESVKGERDELNANVRDLRVRVEESRRAIMRLQGREPAVAAANVHQADTVPATHNKQDARRSMLASWNPREVQAGVGVITTTPASPSSATDVNPATQDPEELAELKKSKRASLAFGPHAQSTIARRLHGHRRIASGSKIGAEEGTAGDSGLMPPPISAGGLRELHLGAATVGPSNSAANKRASILGGSSIFRAPTPDTMADGGEERSSNLLMPSTRASRRASNSSSVSGPSGDGDNVLAPPMRLHSRISPSPSHSSIASPIRERDDFVEEDEPVTATALTSGVFGQQQQAATAQANYQMQRSIMEGKARLRDRDDQINHLKKEMAALRMQLDEANDARAASDACLSALRDFVKNEGNGGSAETALKGVMLPPLPTDKDAEDEPQDTFSAAQSNAASAWRSIGSTIAGLSRKPADEKELPSMPSDSSSTAPMSPSTQIASSFGNLWSRVPQLRESVSASSVTPSEGASAPSEPLIDSRHASIVSSPGNDTAVQNANSSPTAAFRGFNWFSKRGAATPAANDLSSDTLTSSPSAMRVSSPPFANLDNHVINLDQVTTPTSASARTASYTSANGSQTGSRKASVTSTAGTAPSVNGGAMYESGREPSGRTKRTMEKSEAVDEDNGFVPPSF